MHRPGGGRCDRGGGERAAPHRPGRATAGRLQARYHAGRLCGDRHHRGAGGGVPAGRVPGRQYRAPVPRTGGGAGGGGGVVRLCGADADANDGLQIAQAAYRAGTAWPAWLHQPQPGTPGRGLWAGARPPRGPHLDLPAGDGGRTGRQLGPAQAAAVGTGAGRRPRFVPDHDRWPGRRRLRLHRAAGAAGGIDAGTACWPGQTDRARQSTRARRLGCQRGNAHRPRQHLPAAVAPAQRRHAGSGQRTAEGTGHHPRRARAYAGGRWPGAQRRAAVPDRAGRPGICRDRAVARPYPAAHGRQPRPGRPGLGLQGNAAADAGQHRPPACGRPRRAGHRDRFGTGNHDGLAPRHHLRRQRRRVRRAGAGRSRWPCQPGRPGRHPRARDVRRTGAAVQPGHAE